MNNDPPFSFPLLPFPSRPPPVSLCPHSITFDAYKYPRQIFSASLGGDTGGEVGRAGKWEGPDSGIHSALPYKSNNPSPPSPVDINNQLVNERKKARKKEQGLSEQCSRLIYWKHQLNPGGEGEGGRWRGGGVGGGATSC